MRLTGLNALSTVIYVHTKFACPLICVCEQHDYAHAYCSYRGARCLCEDCGQHGHERIWRGHALTPHGYAHARHGHAPTPYRHAPTPHGHARVRHQRMEHSQCMQPEPYMRERVAYAKSSIIPRPLPSRRDRAWEGAGFLRGRYRAAGTGHGKAPASSEAATESPGPGMGRCRLPPGPLANR